MIKSFRDKRTMAIYLGHVTKGIAPDLARRALKKLLMIENAQALGDLAMPPGNRLEPLVGNRAGQHSIRIDDQWRICFVWRDDGAADVEFCDEH